MGESLMICTEQVKRVEKYKCDGAWETSEAVFLFAPTSQRIAPLQFSLLFPISLIKTKFQTSFILHQVFA